MPNIPYFQCDTLAYLSSGTINAMTNAEEGIYWRLIVQSWGYPECVLPGDIKVLCRLVKNASQKHVQRVLDLGFTKVGVGYRNERIFEEFKKTCEKSEAARYARKCRKDKELALTDVQRTHNERTTNEVPSSKQEAVSSKQEAKEKSKPLSGKPDDDIPYQEIIDDLNRLSGRSLKSSAVEARKYIKARWSEGYRLEDFKKVNASKVAEWKNDSKMKKYLDPSTLYSPKFERYLNAAPETTQSPEDRINELREICKRVEQNRNAGGEKVQPEAS